MEWIANGIALGSLIVSVIAIFKSHRSDYLPYPKLLPQQEFDVWYLNYSRKPHHEIVITWSDDFGENRSKSMVVDM